ncbi:hypothetical protein GLA29479_2390 [Lysobacter antibioticus]|nr:hypothetical protein GLA29479_2390 [Lysobacter antibioticus]
MSPSASGSIASRPIRHEQFSFEHEPDVATSSPVDRGVDAA